MRVSMYSFTLSPFFISFFSRKIFLEKRADFVGLTSTMQNLLGFLNLAELGIGASIGYVFTNRFSTEIGTG